MLKSDFLREYDKAIAEGKNVQLFIASKGNLNLFPRNIDNEDLEEKREYYAWTYTGAMEHKYDDTKVVEISAYDRAISRVFVRRPEQVEAEQLTERTIKQVYEFIHGARSVKTNSKIAEDKFEDYKDLVIRDGMVIRTPEKTSIAKINDWIVKHPNGDIYTYSSDQFVKLYERED